MRNHKKLSRVSIVDSCMQYPDFLPLTFCRLQVRTERGVLPDNHPQRLDLRLDKAVASVEAGDREGALGVLRPIMEEEAEVKPTLA